MIQYQLFHNLTQKIHQFNDVQSVNTTVAFCLRYSSAFYSDSYVKAMDFMLKPLCSYTGTTYTDR